MLTVQEKKSNINKLKKENILFGFGSDALSLGEAANTLVNCQQ